MDNVKNEGLTLEESMIKLEGIVRDMNDESISLEDSFRLYKDGIKELEKCNKMIEDIEKEMNAIEEGAANE
ncbi:MAG: exodeoxyribonuclease VII small subunit [Lachnospiraceae bacterium]|nr:exodeoxyribonuclease VII small subunit [Lachnospiraceae bacterium]